jgi:ribosome-binding factor A
VYYSQLGPKGASPSADAAAATASALASASRHLRSVLGRQVRLKYLPELDFRIDPAIEQGERVEAIIRKLHEPGGGTTP